jgi:hypothetical protein
MDISDYAGHFFNGYIGYINVRKTINYYFRDMKYWFKI